MIFHLSIDADDPRHVAGVLAELMGGEAMPFPPVSIGSWMALAGGQETAMLPCAVPGPSYPYPCHVQCRETDPSCHDRVHALDLALTHTALRESCTETSA